MLIQSPAQAKNEQLIAATEAIFEATPPYVGTFGGDTRVCYVENTIKHVFNRSIELDLPPQETPMLPVFSADVIRRGLVNRDEMEFDEHFHGQVSLMLRRLNGTRELFDKPDASLSLVTNIGYIAFCNVILRPDGLVVPNVQRKLHSSDLGDHQNDPLAEAFRHRHNYLVRVIEQGVASPSKERALQGYITDKGTPDIDKFAKALKSNTRLLSPRTIKAMTRIGIAQMAHRVLPLDYASAEESKSLKEEYIERGYEIIEQDPQLQNFGKELLAVEIDKQVARHILAGDKSGGGHHLGSLDPNFVTQIGPIETIDFTSKSGAVSKIPISRVLMRNAKGVVVTDTVTSFFPTDWTEAEILEAIAKPVRYMYGRERTDGATEDYVMSKGILIKRVYTDDDKSRLITAYPSIVIPQDVKKRLSGK